jgi:hypothetical protein
VDGVYCVGGVWREVKDLARGDEARENAARKVLLRERQRDGVIMDKRYVWIVERVRRSHGGEVCCKRMRLAWCAIARKSLLNKAFVVFIPLEDLNRHLGPRISILNEHAICANRPVAST